MNRTTYKATKIEVNGTTVWRIDAITCGVVESFDYHPTSEAEAAAAVEELSQTEAECWAESAWLRHAEAGVDDGFDEWEAARGCY